MIDYRNSNISIDWVKWVLIGIGTLIAILILFIPLVFIFVTACSEGWLMIRQSLCNYDMQHAAFLTILIALLSLFINLIFGIFFVWLVTRFIFRGRELLLTLVNVPIAISPITAGLLYLLLYGHGSLVGNCLNNFDIRILFAWPCMVLVTVFITFPIVVHELIPMMLRYGKEEDEVAILLGASGWKMFWCVTLKNIRWPLLHGIVLANARAIGEFGALSIVSGLIRGETYTLSLQVELLYQDYNTVGAFVASLLLAFIAIFTLLLKSIVRNFLVDEHLC